jgi:hypothetical protein
MEINTSGCVDSGFVTVTYYPGGPRGCVNRYQSIDDTIVQLFISQASVVMVHCDRFNRTAHNEEHQEEEDENINGANLARRTRQHRPQDRLLA